MALGNHFERQRRQAVAAFAAANGYELDADITAFAATVSPFRLFNAGQRRKISNLIRSRQESDELALCDYLYVVGTGKHAHSHTQTVCVVRPARRRLPRFALRRQNAVFDFLGKVFGGQDIDFDTDPEFSKAFVLQTADNESDLRARFDETVRRGLVALAAKGLQCESSGDALVLHYGVSLKPERFAELVDDARRVCRLIEMDPA